MLRPYTYPTTCKKRWRMALNAISFVKALLRVSKKAFNIRTPRHLHSFSYMAIDVDPEHDHTPPRDDQPFEFSKVDPKLLSDMVKDKRLDSLTQLGGVRELATLLETDVKRGVRDNQADIDHRKRVLGVNVFQKPPSKGFLSFVLEAFKDVTIIIFLVCAVLSLGFGINFKQSRQFQKLSAKSSNIGVEVVRGGRHQSVSIFEVVVGDIAHLKIGDQVSADRLFLEGHSLKVDESSMTGIWRDWKAASFHSIILFPWT
ncbi:putative calcium-transporting ATPase 13 [Spatholobus suberectus]|nr:putative calcium-transporting ATPase 13 [Spatholobus suberectus]